MNNLLFFFSPEVGVLLNHPVNTVKVLVSSACLQLVFITAPFPYPFLIFSPEAALRQNSAGFGAWLQGGLKPQLQKGLDH